MNEYFKLVNFEVRRFSKLFLTLIVAVTVVQIIGAFMTSFNFMERVETTMAQKQLGESEYVLEYGAYNFQNFIFSEYFILSIVFAATILVIYVFFIWYRDWLGKSSFIYRLLMLPTARRNIYFAKLTAILLFVLCLVGVQIALIEVVQQIIHGIIPDQLRVDQSKAYIYSFDVLSFLYPKTPLLFILLYGLGATVVAVVFTAILFERSYHLKGILLGAIYIIISILVIAIPVIIQDITGYLYLNEIIGLTAVTSILTLGVALYLADYLLKRKINV
ncbi:MULTISPECIES: hypothetical protein [Solibacillus]|uniref:ABC transporter permease n=1 Tax=Solibacillus merdavium TaxID=2762218 RepID=A0ABR8XMP0_9BACL|nr:hypothetical protein [Solibacillus merdavium]MBD8033203.1 hypothetical protein [Solibacillus merdavium]